MTPYGHLPGVGKIAVLRANAIGDFVFALPALHALRAAYPRAEIVLLGLPWHAAFLEGRAGPVDRVVVVPPCRGVGSPIDSQDDPQALDAFFRGMQAERFDLAIQLHGGGRYSNPFVKRLGARVTAGLQAEDAEALDRTIPYVYFQSEIIRYLEVMRLVGAAPQSFDPALGITGRDREAAAAVLGEMPGPLALLHPGATDARRRWPLESFAEVGRALAGAGATVLINGTAAEAGLCADVATSVAGAHDICGRLSLGGLLGVLERCSVVVANDTGPMHLAAALGIPTVAIYWCFNLVNSSQLTRERHRPFVSWTTHCPECRRDCTDGRCDHEVSFVAAVPAGPVAAAALGFLQQTAALSGAERHAVPRRPSCAGPPVAPVQAAATPSDTSPASAQSST